MAKESTEEKLKALQEIENKAKGINIENIEEKQDFSEDFQNETKIHKLDNRDYLNDYKLPEAIDGYRVINNEDLPFNGKLYPYTWRFAYRCPTSLEVANFSTINEQDMPAIQTAVEELIKRCFIILDSNSNNQVSCEEINDGDRLFFFLKLREFYLHDKPISYVVLNIANNEPVTVNLTSNHLQFPELKDKLLSYFDGRTFEIPVNEETTIKFLIPNFKISSRIFKYMVKTYQEIQKEDSNANKTVESFDKQFLLFAPYLYETGSETVENLKLKFKNIQKNDILYKAYINLVNKIKLSNLEKIVYSYKESEEEALIKFPGGWKNMFVDSGAFEDLF